MQSRTEGQTKLRALKISAIAIFSVVIVEVTLGSAVNSLAIVSDGLHALLDALSCVMLFFAVRASMKPPDEEHTYGHEKFETIGGLLGGVVLIGVALLIFYEAALRLISGTQIDGGFEYVGFVAIAYALSIAALRVTVFRQAEHMESQSMKAGLYDAIADLSSTLIALVGFGLAILGISYADSVASIFLGAMLTYLSIKLVKNSVLELSDTASKETVTKVRKAIFACEGVVKVENLKVRKVGAKVFIDASVQVPNAMSLEDAHALSSKIENCLKDALGNVDATIHVEPSDKEQKMKELVQKLATFDGVKEVHEISTSYVGGKLYITLHAYADPNISVEEAHRLADLIERKVYAGIKPLENVTVHIEPAGVAIAPDRVDEAELQKIVYQAAEAVRLKLQIRRIVTYVASGKRYINIDCCFTKQVPIKEAHRMASQLEKEVKERFASAVVTVHIEPFCE
ncbi:MAG: cation diffusion facilitator family transporter [Candidatus Bathyarchaeia archaeon]|jgi:cation diffusion facilitator family transporter